MSPPRPLAIYAVVLHFRHWPLTARTIDALLAQSYPLAGVVVVDNDSGPEFVKTLRQELTPAVQLISLPTNAGYAAGMNAGLRHVAERCDAVLLLTHECVLAPDALAHLADRMTTSPRLGADGPLLGFLDQPDRVFSGGGLCDSRTWDLSHRTVPAAMDEWVDREPLVSDWLDGACVLLRTAAWRRVGPLREHYFLYFEEAEYMHRLRRAGWDIECVPSARAWQQPGGMALDVFVRNRLRFVRDTAPLWIQGREILRVMVRLTRAQLGHARHADRMGSPLGSEWRGLLDFLIGRTGRP
jgi:GT2 family glycosyltransferase